MISVPIRLAFVCAFTLWMGHAASSQTDSLPPQVLQVSGLVVTGDSLSPLPYCTVFRSRLGHG